MKTEIIPISQIEGNSGQVPGLPANPRLMNSTKLDKLVKSIEQDPEMLELRGLMVYPIDGGKYVTIGGNMRLQALKRLGYKECPCVVIPRNTPLAKLRNYIVKDNSSFGDWDYDVLQSNWKTIDLDSWAIDVPNFGTIIDKEGTKRAAWHSGENAKDSLCDMADNAAWHIRRNFSFFSSFKKSAEGYPLSAIKSDFGNVGKFADAAIDIISRVIGLHAVDGWAILTTPKRRHKERNFAEAVCMQIAERTRLPFYADAIAAKNKHRVNPEFSLCAHIREANVVIYDDILTTGSTLNAVNQLLQGKNCLYVVGIDNN